MAAEASILSALNTRLSQLTFSPAIPVSYPNVNFTPPSPSQTARWLRATHLPADTFSQTLDYGGTLRYAGLYQVDIFTGVNFGEPNATAIAELIISWFKRGTRLTKNNFTIETDAPFRMSYVKDAESDSWWMLPVRIPYICYAKNPA